MHSVNFFFGSLLYLKYQDCFITKSMLLNLIFINSLKKKSNKALKNSFAVKKSIMTRSLLLGLVGCLFSIPLSFSAQAQSGLKLDTSGNPVITYAFAEKIANETVFTSLDGRELRLSDYQGKIVVLDFWQTWCGPCLVGFKGLQKAKENWPDQIEILAVSPDWADSKKQILKFKNKNPYDFDFVLGFELGKQLQMSSIPYKIVFDPEGKLIESISGTKGAEGEYQYLKSLVDNYFKGQ